MTHRLQIFFLLGLALALSVLHAQTGTADPPQTMAPFSVKTSRMGLVGLTLAIDVPGNDAIAVQQNHIRKATIASVLAGSPAAKAGVRAKESIAQIDGRTVTDLSLPELQGLLGAKNPGDYIRLGILSTKGISREVVLTIPVPRVTAHHS